VLIAGAFPEHFADIQLSCRNVIVPPDDDSMVEAVAAAPPQAPPQAALTADLDHKQ
jgi:hypothetical protein